MIILDIITIYQPEKRMSTAGPLRIFSSQTVAKRFMRVRDERFPNEEMLIPLEALEDDLKNARTPSEAEAETPKLRGQLLLDPLV